LIGLDVGILTGPDAPMPWDQEKYPAQPYWPDAWRKDHTLRSGMAVSAVPAFRLLATKIGAERMRAGLARLHYGNEDVGGGLDLFWLKGAIRISGAEQLELVSKLSAGTLPFSAEAQRSLREAIRIEESPGATLFGKTGTGSAKDDEDQSDDVPTRAWLVGWVETKGERYPFASWVEGPTTKEARAMRTKAVWGILRELGLLPPGQAGR
jgi:beta-lactamase class D